MSICFLVHHLLSWLFALHFVFAVRESFVCSGIIHAFLSTRIFSSSPRRIPFFLFAFFSHRRPPNELCIFFLFLRYPSALHVDIHSTVFVLLSLRFSFYRISSCPLHFPFFPFHFPLLVLLYVDHRLPYPILLSSPPLFYLSYLPRTSLCRCRILIAKDSRDSGSHKLPPPNQN